MQYFISEYPDFLKDSDLSSKTVDGRDGGQDGEKEIRTIKADAMAFYEEGLKSENITYT